MVNIILFYLEDKNVNKYYIITYLIYIIKLKIN